MRHSSTVPSSETTEKSFLSCVLQWPDETLDAFPVDPGFFHRETYRIIFGIVSLLVEERKPVDPVSVWRQLELRNLGSDFASFEDLFYCAATRANAGHYHGILSKLAKARKILLKADTLRNSVMSSQGEDLEVLLPTIEDMLNILTDVECPSGDVRTVEALWGELIALHRTGKTSGDLSGWPDFDRHFSTKEGRLTLVTGIPGSGKSSWVDNLCLRLASRYHRKIAYYSAENLPAHTHLAALMEIHSGSPFSPGQTRRLNVDNLLDMRNFFEERFSFFDPPDPTPDRILQMGADLHKRGKLDVLVIDPWSHLTHNFGGLSETQYTAQVLVRFQRFVRRTGVHLFLIAHPAKLLKRNDGSYPVPTPYDIAGSAHFRNLCDNCLSIHRPDSLEHGIQVYIQKVRFREEGRLGSVSMDFDPVSGTFNSRDWNA